MDPSQVDVTKLSDNDKKELNQFLTNEAQRTTVQQSMLPSIYPFYINALSSATAAHILLKQGMLHAACSISIDCKSPLDLFIAYMFLRLGVHHLTDACWKKCITSRITAGRLDSSEESCAQNCVERWMDTNLAVLKHLEVLRGQ